MAELDLTNIAQASIATPAAGVVATFVESTTKKICTKDENAVVSILVNDGLHDRNLLTNGGFTVQQRVAVASTAIPTVSATTRAGQVADRWAATVGNVTTPSWQQVDTSAANEALLTNRYYGKITQATNAAKFVLSQVIINTEMMHLRGTKVRLSVKIKQFVGTAATFRLGLLQLVAAGTADTMPSPFLSAIGADSVEPTWGTNLAAITPDASPVENGTISGVALSITGTTGWIRSSAVFTIPTDAKNLVVVIYRHTVGAANDATGIAEVMMTQGPDLVDWVSPPLDEEVTRCQRFFCKSFPMTVVPAASLAEATAGSGATGLIGKAGAVVLAANYSIQFPVVMWKTPAITYFTPTAVGAQCWRFSGAAAAAQTATASRASSVTDRAVVVTATGDAGGAVGDLVGVHFTADAEFLT